MCNLALFNKAFLDKHAEYIHSLLSELVYERGGDGNGVACLHTDNSVSSLRGLGNHATPSALYRWMLDEANAEWFLFHTRMRTTAPPNRVDLVQPFDSYEGTPYDGEEEKKRLVMCHVGTLHAIDIWSIEGQAVSDGRMLFELATRYSDNPILDMTRVGMGSMAGFYDGAPFIVDCSKYVTFLRDSASGTVCFHTGYRVTPLDGYKEYSINGAWYYTEDGWRGYSR